MARPAPQAVAETVGKQLQFRAQLAWAVVQPRPQPAALALMSSACKLGPLARVGTVAEAVEFGDVVMVVVLCMRRCKALPAQK
jgi:hypothetical protein